MKIYFTASIGAKVDHPEMSDVYEKIVYKLEEMGHEVMADHVLELDYAFVQNVDDNYRVQYYRQMIDKINRADLILSEMTYSSASIGHEVTLALDKNKPLIIASQQGVPQIFRALPEGNIYSIIYKDVDELLERLGEELQNVKEGEDIRFNFLIPPSMVDYLEWVSRNKRVPKSVYLRNLIRREMEENPEYDSR